MEARLSDHTHTWNLEELVALLDDQFEARVA